MEERALDSGLGSELSRLQRWFHAVVTHPSGVGAGVAGAAHLAERAVGSPEMIVTRSRALSAEDRLNIYAQAYHARLLECLGEIFPMVKRVVGEDAFNGFAFGYLQKYPSRSYTLNELGRLFPRYLEETRPAASAEERPGACPLPMGWPDFLVDLSRLEWAIYDVFDGPGVEGQELLGAQSLLGIAPEDWPRARLRTVPCLRLLAARFPVNDYYTELREASQTQPALLPIAAESFVALTRRDFVVRRCRLTRVEFEVLDAIGSGKTVGEAIASIYQEGRDNAEQLAGDLQRWFARWTLEGFFLGIEV